MGKSEIVQSYPSALSMCTGYLLALDFFRIPGDQPQTTCTYPLQIQTDFETLFLSILRKNRETRVKISHFQLDFPLNLRKNLSNNMHKKQNPNK